MMQITEVQVLPRGWVMFPEWEPPILVAFEPAEDGRLEPTGIVVPRGHTLSARFLAEIPFGRLEAIANLEPMADHIRDSIEDPDYETQTWEIPDDLAGGASGAGLLQELDELGELADGWSGHHSDRFYRLIAALYQWATYHYPGRPAARLADLLQVPVGNVRRWVMVARSDKYKYLPKGRTGKGG